MTPRLHAWTTPLLAALACTMQPAAVGAQTGGWVSFNGGTQATATDFRNNVVFTEFHEDADFNSGYAVGTGAIFDGGAGVELANGLGFGVAISRFNRLDPVSIDARVPHPFFFNRPRSFTGSEPDLERLETALHVEIRWSERIGDAVELGVFGGPTLFNIRQDLVTAIGYDHAYPYDEASLSSASKTTTSASAIGFHAGADVGFYFSEVVGPSSATREGRSSYGAKAKARSPSTSAGSTSAAGCGSDSNSGRVHAGVGWLPSPPRRLSGFGAGERHG